MFNSAQKVKKIIKDPKKLKQIDSWKQSDLSKISSSVHKKDRASFDTTTEFLDNCINFHKDEIEFMLSLGIDIDCCDKDNLTALHQACINAKLDLVNYLLNKNANINAVDKEGWTPLHISASIGSLELAKCLIDRGARLDIVNYDGDLPIALVDEAEYPELKTFFQLEMNKRNISEVLCRNLERAIMMEDVMIWKSTGLYEPPIDNSVPFTPLHVAASKNYLDILTELTPLVTRKELNARDMDGWTPLHAAAHWGNREACLILVKAGADMDAVTKSNETVLDITDPLIKDELEEDFRKFKMENIRPIEILSQVNIRNEGQNKRSTLRTSMVRQSIQMKKFVQSKDPLMERQIHDAAQIEEISSASSSIEEDYDRHVSPRSKSNFASIVEGEESSVSSRQSAETPSYSTISVTTPCTISQKSDDAAVTNKDNEIEEIESKNITKPLFDGDNITVPRNNNDDEFSRENNPDINNAASCTSVEKDQESDIDNDDVLTVDVKIRPRSERDSIIEHRNTINRRSLVMAPSKCDEAEAIRREKSRRVRSNRRSTQGIDLETVEAIKKRQAELANGSVEPTQLIQPIKEERESTLDVVDSVPANDTSSLAVIDNSNLNLNNAQNSFTAPTLTSPDFSYLIPKFRIISQLETQLTRSQNSQNIPGQMNTKPDTDTFITPSSNTISNKQTNTNKSVSESRYNPSNRTSAQDIKPATKELVSGSYVARPMAGNPSTNLRTSISEIMRRKPVFKYPTDKSEAEVPPVDDKNLCQSFVNNLSNNHTKLKEQNEEIKKLKARIQELENEQLNKSQRPRNLNDDAELIQVKKENKTLKQQNESLLRVIGKIQQELHSIQHIELPK